MKTRRYLRWLLIGAAVLGGLALAGCSGPSSLLGASWPGISLNNNTIYLAELKVYAFDQDGTPKWSFPDTLAQNQGFFAPPAADDTMIVVTDYADSVFALNPADGKAIWTFKVERSRFIGGAVLGDKLVYAATADGSVHAITRQNDGAVAKEAWKFAAEGSIWSAPLLADGTLYVTSLDRHIYALDAETGKLEWKFPDQSSLPENPPLGGIVGTPTLHNGVLYFGSFNNHLYALDAKEHKVLWRFDTSNWVWGSPVVDDESGYVIAADLDGHIFAIDTAKGEINRTAVWTVDAKSSVVGSPVLRTLEDGTVVVYVTSGGQPEQPSLPNLFILNVKDGANAKPAQTVKFDFQTTFLIIPTGTNSRSVKLYPAPVFTDGTLIVATHEGDNALYAFDSTTLAEKWKRSLKDTDTKLTAAKSPSGAPPDTGLFSSPINTLLLITAVFFLVMLVLRPPQGAKKK